MLQLNDIFISQFNMNRKVKNLLWNNGLTSSFKSQGYGITLHQHPLVVWGLAVQCVNMSEQNPSRLCGLRHVSVFKMNQFKILNQLKHRCILCIAAVEIYNIFKYYLAIFLIDYLSVLFLFHLRYLSANIFPSEFYNYIFHEHLGKSF